MYNFIKSKIFSLLKIFNSIFLKLMNFYSHAIRSDCSVQTVHRFRRTKNVFWSTSWELGIFYHGSDFPLFSLLPLCFNCFRWCWIEIETPSSQSRTIRSSIFVPRLCFWIILPVFSGDHSPCNAPMSLAIKIKNLNQANGSTEKEPTDLFVHIFPCYLNTSLVEGV